MLGLPQTTVVNRRIPKQKFYRELGVSPKIKQSFVDQVELISWSHKLAPDTLNLNQGAKVGEIQVIEIDLKNGQLNENVVTLIDREIPYHLVFVIRFQEQAQLWIAYKDPSKRAEQKFTVNRYYKTDWLPYGTLKLQLAGLNLDQVYESFLLQIAGDKLRKRTDEDLEAAVARSINIEKLEKAIAVLENKIQREKQFNRQVEFNSNLRKLKLELDRLEGLEKGSDSHE